MESVGSDAAAAMVDVIAVVDSGDTVTSGNDVVLDTGGTVVSVDSVGAVVGWNADDDDMVVFDVVGFDERVMTVVIGVVGLLFD